jgi:hypothetical protein
MGGRLGKFLKGVAEVAVPAAENAARERFAMRRDKALNEMDAARTQQAQSYSSAENEKQNKFIAQQDELSRTQNQQQFDANREDRNRIQDADFAERKRSTDAVLEQAAVAIQDAKLDNKTKADIRKLQDVLMDDNQAENHERAKADLEILVGGKNSDEDYWMSTEVYGEPDKFSGEQQRSTQLYNRRSGATRNLQPPGQPARIQSQEEYDALPAGALFVDPDDGQTYRKE